MNFCLKEGSAGGITFYFITIICWMVIDVITFRYQKDYHPEWEDNFIKFLLFNKNEPIFSTCNLFIILMFIFNIMRVICTLIYGYAPEG